MSVGYSYERTWYAFGMRAKTRSEESFERKVGDTRTFDEAENFSKSRGTTEIFKVRVARWFPGIWSLLKAAHGTRSLYHKLNLTIYMAADNEIYCWTKVENFWRVSTTFCRPVGRDSPAKRLLLLGRILVRTKVALAPVRDHEREKCLVRSTV